MDARCRASPRAGSDYVVDLKCAGEFASALAAGLSMRGSTPQS